jgi:hypothetical protein
LSDELLNLYQDEELTTGERSAVEAHLARCQACRAELASLRSLFAKLDALRAEPLAADLTPIVMRRIAAHRQRTAQKTRTSWVVSALQAATIALLLIFGWSALAMQYDTLAQHVPAESLRVIWTDALARGNEVWHAIVIGWPIPQAKYVLSRLDPPVFLDQIVGHGPKLPSLGLNTTQATIIGLAATLMWLGGNSILLRMTAARSKVSHFPKH